MKTLGLIGGISWVSTLDYYKLINQGVNEKLGGLNASKCLIYSFNYADLKNDHTDWEQIFEMVLSACQTLQAGGAEGLLLCANTMHLLADRLEQNLNIPLIHIASVTAIEIQKSGLKKVGLLGTKFTMEMDFFKEKLAEKGIETIIPNDKDREFVHQTIYEELGVGIFKPETKERYLSIILDLMNTGAEGIVLGCTEIPLIIKQSDVFVPVFDTVAIHSNAAITFQLAE